MPTVMLMHWPEITKEQYEAARKEVNWEGNTPQGAKFHTSYFADDGFHVFDLWESPQDFQRFVAERLTPGLAKIGVSGEPKVQLLESYAVFAPNP